MFSSTAREKNWYVSYFEKVTSQHFLAWHGTLHKACEQRHSYGSPFSVVGTSTDLVM